jgi:hypothetical protein
LKNTSKIDLKSKMERTEVYKVIDTERDFQIKMAGTADRPDILKKMTPGDVLGAIKVNLDKAYAAWYYDSPEKNYQDTMEFVRKIAALCVQTMEDNGAPERK